MHEKTFESDILLHFLNNLVLQTNEKLTVEDFFTRVRERFHDLSRYGKFLGGKKKRKRERTQLQSPFVHDSTVRYVAVNFV